MIEFFVRRAGVIGGSGCARIVPALIVVVAAALAATLPAQAATVHAHNRPNVYCNNSGQIVADLPTSVSTTRSSEPVWARFHLLKNVNGVWRYVIADDHYFTNYATFGGALLGGWLPDGNPSIWGAYQADFYVPAGEYRVAMELGWWNTGAYAYEWAGPHIIDDPWNFTRVIGGSCFYPSASGSRAVRRHAPNRSASPPRPKAAKRPAHGAHP
jgi:hypothetical protein